MKLIHKILLGLGIVAFFLILSYGFVPEVLQGKIVDQSDIAGYSGMAREMSQWNKAHPDDPTYWTGSMFSGMPTTAITNQNGGDLTQGIYDALLFGERPATYFFIALLGGFLLMLAFGVHWLIAVAAAVAMAFCTYNMQIINVGHNTKMQAIAFLPWALAALVFTYRSARGEISPRASLGRNDGAKNDSRQWLPLTVLGACLFGIALSLQIKANHQQITYYLAIMVLLYALTEFIAIIIKKGNLGRFFLASGLLLVLGGVGIATNANKLLPLWEYTPNSIRGGSELSGGESATKGGLDLEYATAWSYGWEELPNLLIPDFNGGGTANDVSGKDLQMSAAWKSTFGQDIPEYTASLLYSGPQPGTAGPMYLGAITIFLFILGLMLYDGREKWWLVAATVIAILLAVGHHFMAFTKAAFDLLPMYSKFRSVSMALVILQYTLPVLGFLTLDRICKDKIDRKRFLKSGGIALGITGGICALMALVPSIGGMGDASGRVANFLSRITGISPENLPQDIVRTFSDALTADKTSMVRHDAFMALLLIAATFLLLLWAYSPKAGSIKNRKWIAAGTIGVLVIINMFSVGKRYLNSDDFTTPSNFSSQFQMRSADKEILKDTDPSYRVLDLSTDTWNSSVASFHHKSIGGYSPAKLQRYQDLYAHPDGKTWGPLGMEIALLKANLGDYSLPELIQYIGEEGGDVLSALNMRYAIGPDGKKHVNPYALGNAWPVKQCTLASSVDEEYDLLFNTPLDSVAIIGPDFANKVAEISPRTSLGRNDITLTSYAPNELRYSAEMAEKGLVVFSEIWYPGWVATVDGQPLELLRADWTLRAAILPEGRHEVVMRFEPECYRKGRNISLASSITLLLLTLIAAGGFLFTTIKKKADNA
ncbi:MAG: hypothetical protein J6W74_00345 [Bacteroidales bacterium]|nr:hypothetical protein [Bacteroidales bacterium]